MARQETRQGSSSLRDLFSARLKEAQAALELKNEELARDVDVSVRLIQKYRAGTVLPREETLAKLAHRLGREIGWFFTEDGKAAA